MPSSTQICIQLFKFQLQRNSAPGASEVSLLISTVACLSHHWPTTCNTSLRISPYNWGGIPAIPIIGLSQDEKGKWFFICSLFFLMLWNGRGLVQPAWVLCCKKLSYNSTWFLRQMFPPEIPILRADLTYCICLSTSGAFWFFLTDHQMLYGEAWSLLMWDWHSDMWHLKCRYVWLFFSLTLQIKRPNNPLKATQPPFPCLY